MPHLAGRFAAPAAVLAQALLTDVGQQLPVALGYGRGDGVIAAPPRQALYYDADLPRSRVRRMDMRDDVRHHGMDEVQTSVYGSSHGSLSMLAA